MNSDKIVRATGYLSVFAVSAVAALISYWHAVTVVGKHGEPGVYGHLYPVVIDGLIMAASMVLLDSARNHEDAPRLAWWLVGAGIFGTLGANVLDGISYGFLGSVIAAWPAAAFVGAYEMIMVLIRSAARRSAVEPEPAPEPRIHVGQREYTTEEYAQAFNPPAPPAPDKDTPPAWYQEMYHPAPAASYREGGASSPLVTLPGITPDDTQEVRALSDSEMSAMSGFGQVQVQSPLSRLDRKVPAGLRETGSFPAVKD